MWSNEWNEEVLSEIRWIVFKLDGHIAYNGDWYVIGKEPFSQGEANEALEAWYKEMEIPGQFEPVNWRFAKATYRVVQGSGKDATYQTVDVLADADVDWDSMEEYDRAEALKVGEYYVSPGGYLWVYRIVE